MVVEFKTKELAKQFHEIPMAINNIAFCAVSFNSLCNMPYPTWMVKVKNANTKGTLSDEIKKVLQKVLRKIEGLEAVEVEGIVEPQD